MKPAENTPALGAHIKHQKALSALRRQITSIQDKVDEQARIEGETAAKIPTVNGFDVELEDLAAAEVLGKITPAEHKTRREEIAKRRASTERTAAAIEKEVAAVRPALGGLRRLLTQAKADLEKLERDTSDRYGDALLEQAELVGAEYAAAALEVWRRYLQLRALHGFLLAARGRDIAGLQMYGLLLPTFSLESHKDFESGTWPGFVCGWELVANDNRPLQAAAEVERERLRALGI